MKRIKRRCGLCTCINFVVIFAQVILYYKDIVFNAYNGIVLSAAIFINCIVIRTVFKKSQIVLFRFKYGFIKGRTEMHIKLKSGKEDLYQNDFDLSANGADLIIVRQDNYFETYSSDDIATLTIKNDDEHKAEYKYINSNWVLQ